MEDKLQCEFNPDSKYFGMLKPTNIKNTSFFYLPNKINKIGRSNECDIIFTHPSISKFHAILEFCENGDVVLRDLNSSNGCFVNGMQLKDGMPIFLNNNDKLNFGKDSVIYQIIINNNKSDTNIKERLKNDDNLFKTASNGFGQIRDKVTLVNLDLIKKANVNHFINNIHLKNEDKLNKISNNIDNYEQNKEEYEEYKIENKNNVQYNSNSFNNDKNNKAFSISSNYSIHNNKFPKINQSNNNNIQELDLTFKNGKNSIEYSNSAKRNKELRMSYDNNILKELEFYKNEKIKFEKRNLEVETILSDKETEINNLNEQLKKNNQEFLKLNSKHNGLLLYASDLQKKVEFLEIELLEKDGKITKFQQTDWGELISRRDEKINILQNDILYYKNELNKIKSVLGNEKAMDNDIPRRIDNLIDSYISENKKYKRMIEEYKLRENQCTKKWSDLLKENQENKTNINFLTKQIADQSQNFNSFIAENDRKLINSMNNIVCYIEKFDSNKAEAAEFLVNQMNLIMDEKRKVIAENIVLDNQLSSLKNELERLQREYEKLNEYKHQLKSKRDTEYEETPQTTSKILINNLRLKIEELEDLIAQQSSMIDPSKIAEYEKTISEDNKVLAEKDFIINQLKSKIQEILKRPNYLFDEKQAIYSLTQAMREKDVLILDLKKALRDLKENNYKYEIFREQITKRNHLLETGSPETIKANQYNDCIEKIENFEDESNI